MPTKKRTFRSYNPAFAKNVPGKQDRKKSLTLNLGTISATNTQELFRAPSECLLKQVSIIVTTTVAASNTDFWDFDIVNKTNSGDVFTVSGASAPDTRAASLNGLTANTNVDLYNDAADVDQGGFYLAPNDVLQLVSTKHASGANLVGVLVQLEFEISGMTTTTSSTTTTTSSSTTTTSTSSTTTTTTTTSTTTTIT